MKFPKVKMTTTMEISRTKDGWQLSCDIVQRDFHIREETEGTSQSSGERWMLDEFDSSAQDDNAAHVESDEHPTLQDAINEAFDRCEDYLNHPITVLGEVADELRSRLEHVPPEHITQSEKQALENADEIIKP